MTLRQLFREFVLAKEAREDLQDRGMSVAWHSAAFQRQDKLPPLSKFLHSAPNPMKRQTPTQQRSMLSFLSERYGIPLKRVTLKLAAAKA